MKTHSNSAIEGFADPGIVKSSAYINGEWRRCDDTFNVTNPADGSWIADVCAVSSKDSADVVTVAHAAFPAWAALLPQERSAMLFRWFSLVRDHMEDLALLMTLEQGKPISESRGEIDYGAAFIEFFAEQAKRPDIMSVTSHLPNAEVEV